MDIREVAVASVTSQPAKLPTRPRLKAILKIRPCCGVLFEIK
jgi:hypothetical protein